MLGKEMRKSLALNEESSQREPYTDTREGGSWPLPGRPDRP